MDDGDDVGVRVTVGVAVGDDDVCVGVGVGVAVDDGDDVGVGVAVGVGVGATATVNALLVPVCVPSVAVISTLEPALVKVTEVEPTPPTKAFIVDGVIDPAEHVKEGVPT